MSYKDFVILLVAFCFAACSKYNKQELTLDGMLYYRTDAMLFVPCGAKDRVINVVDETESLAKLYKDTLQYYYIGEPVYAELKGTLQTPRRVIKIGETEPSMFIVKQVISLTKRANAPKECTYSDYTGGGHNPTWTFEISEIDETITFRDDVARQSYVFDYAEPFLKGDTLIYAVQNKPMQQTLNLYINRWLTRGELSTEKQYPTNAILNDKYYTGFCRKASNQ